MSHSTVLNNQRLSIKTQVLATIGAVAGAVVLPQLCHFLGAVLGIGSSVGEMFLPMHLTIILVGLLAGPYAGACAGLLSPLLSFAISGMPIPAKLPFMMLELFGYGLSAGLLRNVNLPSLAKVLISQFAGRIVRAVAILAAVYLFANESMAVASIWRSIPVGIWGLAFQWIFIPLIVYRVEKRKRNNE
jgi:uncharacterized membrane protein